MPRKPSLRSDGRDSCERMIKSLPFMHFRAFRSSVRGGSSQPWVLIPVFSSDQEDTTNKNNDRILRQRQNFPVPLWSNSSNIPLCFEQSLQMFGSSPEIIEFTGFPSTTVIDWPWRAEISSSQRRRSRPSPIEVNLAEYLGLNACIRDCSGQHKPLYIHLDHSYYKSRNRL